MVNRKMYACFVFFPNGEVKRWKYVTDLKSFEQFLSKTHPSWKYMNVYEKSTKQYLKRFYPGNIIPKILGLFLLVLSLYAMKNTFSKTTFVYGFNNTATIRNAFKEEKGVLCL